VRGVLSVLLLAVPLAFVAYTVASDWPRVAASLSDASIPWLVAAFLAAALAMIWLAFAWGRVLAFLGQHVQPPRLYASYFVGEIGKYVPGWIWAVVGRAEILRRQGVSRTVAYASVILSLFFFVSTGVVAAVALAPFVLDVDPSLAVVVAACGVVVFAVVAFHPAVGTRLLRMAGDVLGSSNDVALPRGIDAARLAALHAPVWVLIAASMFAAANALDSGADLPRVAAAAVAGWVAGLVSPGGAGIGAREAVFAAASGLTPAVAVAAALISRLAFVAVDAGGAVALMPVLRRYRRRRNDDA
jgi:uncharacterized membrane protein YbhN (UPF0104 family)